MVEIVSRPEIIIISFHVFGRLANFGILLIFKQGKAKCCYNMPGNISLIGWGKPVPVNPNNFRHHTRDDVLVSFAGPASNIIMTLIALVGAVTIWPAKIAVFYAICLALALYAFNRLNRRFDRQDLAANASN